MNPTVLKSASPPPDSAEVWSEERCFIVETWNHTSDPDLSLARARVPPGITTAKHRLAVDERYLIEKGWGRVEVDGIETEVRPGDVILIPRGATQCIRNLGDEDLIFLCVCTPRFEPRHYEDREAEA